MIKILWILFRRTALHLAVRNGSVEFVRLLLDYHTNVNIADENDVTPLHTASSLGMMDIARILLQAGTGHILFLTQYHILFQS